MWYENIRFPARARFAGSPCPSPLRIIARDVSRFEVRVIRFNCPHCARLYELPDALARLPLVCKQCGQRITPPEGATVPPPAPPPPKVVAPPFSPIPVPPPKPGAKPVARP